MKKKVFFTGGGTGGHVYPALAIIEELNKNGKYDISWIGSKNGMEYNIITNYGIKFHSIPSGKLRRYFSFLNFIDLFKIIAGFIKSFFILIKYRPDIIFSKGGYVTVPPIIISKILKIKSVTHESDMSPGLATKINSKFVNKILLPYEETKKYFKTELHDKLITTGNPIRKEFFSTDKINGRKIMGFTNNRPVILVLGGSLGAKEVNDLILDAKDLLINDYNIYHQMGDNKFVETDTDSYKTTPFIREHMADIISASDIIISRAGASAVWEFATVGIPAIFIPLTVGSRGDQMLNARYSEKRGISLVLTGGEINADCLNRSINKLNSNKAGMIKVMNEFKSYSSSQQIVQVIEELI